MPTEHIHRNPVIRTVTMFARRVADSRVYKRLAGIAGTFGLIAFALSVVSVFAFVSLADEVLDKELVGINREVMFFAHSLASPTATSVAFVFTNLGGVIGVTIMTVLLGVWFVHRRKTIDATTLVAIMLGGALLSFTLKLAYAQIRPDIIPRLDHETTFSFPSGHTLISFCFFGFLGAWIMLQNPRSIRRWLVSAGCLFIAGCVGLSRVYLGVHWPTDVLGGFLLATFWVSLCLVVEHRFLQRLKAADPTDRLEGVEAPDEGSKTPLEADAGSRVDDGG